MVENNLIFDIRKSENIINEMQTLFEKNDIYIEVYRTETGVTDDTKEPVIAVAQSYIELFTLKALKPPIYMSIASPVDFSEAMGEVILYRNEVYEKILAFLEKNEEILEEEFKNRIRALLRILDRFKKTFSARAERIDLSDCLEVKEIQDKAAEFLKDTIDSYFIKPVIDSVLAEFENNTDNYNACKTLTNYINGFFENIGISTICLKVGDEMDYDLYIPEQGDDDVSTTDYNLKDKIKVVKKYAYCFKTNDELVLPVSRGKAVVWRFE